MLAIIMVNAGGRHCGVQVQLSSHVRHDDKREKVAKKKPTGARGADHFAAKVTAEIVHDIRAKGDAGWTSKALSNLHGISESTAYKIKSRQLWKHLPEKS